MNLPKKELFRPDEVATIFGYTRQTIYNWVERGKIKPKRNKINNHIFFERNEIEEIVRLSTVIDAELR